MFGSLKTKVGFLAFCLLTSLVLNHVKDGSILAQENKIDYKLVKEINFDKPVSKVIFATAEKDGKEFLYPRTIVFKDEVQFWDEEGKVVATVPVDGEVHTSKQGKFIGIDKRVIPTELQEKHPDDAYKGAMKYLTVYNDEGKEVWHSKEPIASAEETGGAGGISDSDGSVVVGRFEYGGIDFYNAEGMCKTVIPFGEIGWARRSGRGGFSEDGEYFGVIVESQRSRRALQGPGISGEPWVILYDKNGKELWRYQVVEEHMPESFAISRHAQYILFSAYTTRGVEETREGKSLTSGISLLLFDQNGKMTKLDEPVLFNIANFSSDESYLALAYENKIRLIDTESGRVLFEKQLPHEVEEKYITREIETREGKGTVREKIVPYRISHLFISSNAEFLIAQVYKTYPYHEDPKFSSREEASRYRAERQKEIAYSANFVLDKTGNVLWQKSYSGKETPHIPIGISDQAKQIVFSLGDKKIEIFEKGF